jgi:hypothetical protein
VFGLYHFLAALEATQHPVKNNKYDNGSEATTSEFFGAVSGNERSEPIGHKYRFLIGS